MEKSSLRNSAKNLLALIDTPADDMRRSGVMSQSESSRSDVHAAVTSLRINKAASTKSSLRISIFIIPLIILSSSYHPATASWNAGLPGAAFRMPAGAWAAGVGGAVSADPDYMLSWYNPSQLPSLRERRASLGVGYRSLGRAESWASYDFRVPPRAGMGATLVYRGDPYIGGLYDGYYRDGIVVEERALKPAAYTALSAKVGAGYIATKRLLFGASVAINYQSLPTTPLPEDGQIAHSTSSKIGAIDIAASYKLQPNLTLSASIRNLLAKNSWQILSYDESSPIIEETVPTLFALSSSHKTTLIGRDLTWSADAVFFLIDGDGGYLDGPEVVIATGAKWKFSDAITLRAGIADIELSSETMESFSPRMCIGFSYSLPALHQGAVINYAVMTDRVWAGVDQQVGVTVSF